jgi:signal transduction histidine kinase
LSEPLKMFARSILQPVTFSDLVAELPTAFQAVTPARVWCDVQTGQRPAHDNAARLCIPLRGTDSVLAYVTLCWDTPVWITPDKEQLLADAAELASLALENRRASDAERERARAEAADVRFDLIGILAHEMRTPLASIKGYASTMLLDEIDLEQDQKVEFLQAIDEESDRLNELVTHLLDSTVIEAGALELQREPVLLPALVRRVADTMSHRSDRHRIVVLNAPGVDVVFADEQRIQQVLTNLLDNAIKYSPDGGMIVVRSEKRESEVAVAVSDQGVGIAPEHLNKLFERFFRTGQRKTHGVSGTGLGLPIVEAIVRAHGGRIWAESVVDEGTTLTFTLPELERETDPDNGD